MSTQLLEVSITIRNSALSRRGRVVNSQTTKASNKEVRPPPRPPQIEQRIAHRWQK